MNVTVFLLSMVFATAFAGLALIKEFVFEGKGIVPFELLYIASGYWCCAAVNNL